MLDEGGLAAVAAALGGLGLSPAGSQRGPTFYGPLQDRPLIMLHPPPDRGRILRFVHSLSARQPDPRALQPVVVTLSLLGQAVSAGSLAACAYLLRCGADPLRCVCFVCGCHVAR